MKENKLTFITIIITTLIIILTIIYKEPTKNTASYLPPTYPQIQKIEEKDQNLLNKKEKCNEYENNIKLQFKDMYFIEIFYNLEYNTCIIAGGGIQRNSDGTEYTTYVIFDYFNHALLSDYYFYHDTTIPKQNSADMFKNVLGYLKGENTLKYKRADWSNRDLIFFNQTY
ncbi:MAG: hypothetical protein WC917_00045 [Bacilli bacterium]|jgi:hypothetical protein